MKPYHFLAYIMEFMSSFPYNNWVVKRKRGETPMSNYIVLYFIEIKFNACLYHANKQMSNKKYYPFKKWDGKLVQGVW
jgi:hypothetical protein